MSLSLENVYKNLLECKSYNQIRKKYIKTFYWGRPNMLKFKELMQTTNERILLNLAIFTEKAFKDRAEVHINL